MAYERGAALRRRRGLYGICAIQGPAEGERNMSRRTRAERILTEATYAAITEAGISQDGVLAGFVNSIGDYVGGTDADGNYVYWGYTVNGKYVPFACNQMPVLEGDYILWEFQTYTE